MEITFLTAEIRDLCEKREAASDKLGYEAARELEERLADIVAVDTVDELADLLGASVVDAGPKEKELVLQSNHRIRIGSAHPKDIASKDATDWSKTNRVKILEVRKIDG
ncbi:hypothetical protein AUC68_11145 [Methyloceanibacter methanicus]|uniref:Uncharacterized protein n=1 Tax=Methyloceanibacter methanicus TaxID=1774968 RepID=A0A1E3VWZ4_9HYPH|nr:hypothetical protein [Methyloceanibacter methanicus]ODR98050.1 hypothetical protein AUC68_11145 [Methyloceanibacter methanicus]